VSHLDRARLERMTIARDAAIRERDEARATTGTVRSKLNAVFDALGLNAGDRCVEGVVGYATVQQNAIRLAREHAEAAEAEVARLREALEEVRRRIEVMGVGEQSDSVRVHNRLLNQSEDALKVVIDALASAPTSEPDYSGLCSAPECGGHCGFAHARGCEAVREYLADHGGAPYRAPSHAPSAETWRQVGQHAAHPELDAEAAQLRKAWEAVQAHTQEAPCVCTRCEEARRVLDDLVSKPSPFINHRRPDGRTCPYRADDVCTMCGWVKL